jgi:hypothetical protein
LRHISTPLIKGEKQRKNSLSVELDAVHHHSRVDWATCRAGKFSNPSLRVIRVVWQIIRTKRVALLTLPG